MEQIKRKGNHPVMQQNREGEVEYLTFPSLDKTGLVRHLFSTRVGGVSEGIYATMNLSYSRGDKTEAVDENFERIARVLGRSTADFVLSKQTHTTNIRIVSEVDRGKGIRKPIDYEDTDGLVTNIAGIVLVTVFADCVPLFFVDPVKQVIGLAHSGWRGTKQKIGAKMIHTMQEQYDCEPKDILTAIGPSICVDCYEVGEEVAKEFVGKGETIPKPNGKYQLDLALANENLLIEAGILKEHIAVTDVCTCCNPNYLFSHRASDGKRGNLAAFLSLER